MYIELTTNPIPDMDPCMWVHMGSSMGRTWMSSMGPGVMRAVGGGTGPGPWAWIPGAGSALLALLALHKILANYYNSDKQVIVILK